MTGPAPVEHQQRYRLESRIATGGMGEVWRATDTLLDRDVAVKVLKAEYADDPVFRARFEAEARHAASLHHPNVASVFDLGQLPDGDGSGTARPFLVMELVPGRPLSSLVHAGGQMPPTTAADLVAQAADGIAAAHALGIVHRDVKPANLLVTPGGQVKVTDFGIARAGDSSALTQTGQIVGTPHYLSPEQAEGRPATAASDVYALGVVLFECLTGRRPFAGDTPVATALAHLREPVPALPDAIPAQLRAAVQRALAKSPADRFASATELAAALRGDPLAAPATAIITPAPRRRRRRVPAWLPWAGAAVAALIVVGLTLLGNGGQPGTAGAGPSPAPSTQPTDARVRVRRADYLGTDATVAKQRLDGLGLTTAIKRRPNPGGHPQGDVAGIAPVGLVAPGETVVLTAWGAPPAEVGQPATTQPAPDGQGSGKGPEHGSKHGSKSQHGKAKGKK